MIFECALGLAVAAFVSGAFVGMLGLALLLGMRLVRDDEDDY